MKTSAFFPRIFLVLLITLMIVACGATSSAAPEPPASTEITSEGAEEPPAEELPPTQSVTLLATPTALPNTGGGDSVSPPSQPSIPERRRLTLEFPPQIRAGDSDIVRLTLEVDDLGNITPTAEVGGNVVTGETVEIPNLYETHNVIAEARFDIAGMQVSPPGLTSQPLAQGESVSFYWSIRPDGVGVYRGTVWLYLRFVERSSGEESQKAVSAQPVEIEAVNFLGLSGDLARSFGVVGSIAGTVIGFPFFEDIVKFLFRRRGSRRR